MAVVAALWMCAGLSIPGAAQPAPAGSGDGTVDSLLVQRFVFGPSDIFSDEELAAVTAGYTGRTMPVDELHRLVAELDALYEAKGFVGRAVLPPQTIVDGVVEVQLVEGRIHEIIVDGHQHTRTSFIVSRIGLKPGDLVDLHAMADSLAAFNDAYDVVLRAELRPGGTFGTTDYVIHVGEPKNDRFSLWADNGGRVETGADRYGFSWSRASLFGYRDALALTLSGSDGSRSATASYSWPIGLRGARLAASYSYSQIDIVSGPFEAVKLRNDSSHANVRVTVPFVLAGRWPASWSLAYDHRESGMYWEGEEVPDTRRSFGVWQAGADTTVAAGVLRWDFGYTLRLVPGADATKRYATHHVSGSWQRPLWLGVVRIGAATQLTDGVLLPQSEQYTIGGADSNRGYEAGRGQGDTGYSVSVAYTMPLTARMEGTLHLDHGGVFPYKGDDQPISEEDFLTSVAVALHARLTELVGLRLQWGIPLDAHTSGSTFYFRLQATF